MKKTIENTLIALQAPGQIEKDFYTALGVETEKKNVQLGVPKTFCGDGYGLQALSIFGNKQITFSLLANGEKQFPQGEHFLISNIRMYEGVNPVLKDTDWIAGVNNIELKNSTFDVIVNGLRVLKDVPLLELTRSQEQNDSGYLVLLNPIWWLAQTDLEINVKFPVAIATADLNLKFELSGCKYIS